MPSCGCAGTTCSCLITAGAGIAIEGTGTGSNPYQITATSSDIAGLLLVNDTTTVDLTLAGAGSTADPYRLSALARQALVELRDVGGAAPQVGYVPTWTAAAGGNPARFEFKPASAVPVGAILTGAGLSGDGSSGAPLTVKTSGAWGTAPLAVFGSDSLIGAPLYVDSAGNLRSMPRGVDVVANAGASVPAAYPGRMYVRADTGQLYWSNGTTWAATYSPSTPTSLDASVITSGTFPVARLPTGTSSSTVALGDHVHPASAITSGIIAYARMPVGTSSSSVAVGSHTHAATAIGSSGLGFATNVDAAIAWLNENKINISAGSAADSVTSTAFSRTISTGYYAMYMGNGTLIGRNVSSRRYKDNIKPATIDVEKVLALQPVTFHPKGDPDATGRHLGLIAEDAVDVPYLVAYDRERDAQGKEIPGRPLRPETIRYETVLPVVLLAVAKHQAKQIHDLTCRIDALEGA